MQIEIIVFDPHYLMFDLGIALHRYEEVDAETGEPVVRKTFAIGLMLLTINFSIWKKRKD